MQVPRPIFFALQLLVVVLIVCVVGAALYAVLSLDAEDTATDASRMAEVTRLQTTAGIYFGRLQYYDGVCEAIGIQAGYSCHESGTGFAVETRLSDGSYYCADAAGFRGVRQDASGGAACAN